MIARHLTCIFAALLFLVLNLASGKELQPGSVASLKFRDVDGNEISTTAGQITIFTVITRENESKAEQTAHLVPDRCLGNPRYRCVTLVNFQRKIFPPFQGLTRIVIRSRLDAEADKLRPKYAARQIARDPRKHIFVIADFDGSAMAELGLSVENNLAVFVFDGRGRLVRHWSEVPSEEAFAQAIAAAEH